MDNNNMNQQSAYQQTQYQQTQYQQPVYQQQPMYQPQGDLETPMSVGDWMIMMLICCIPCVNFVMLFVWAFSSSTQKSKSNYCKAALIWCAIVLVIEVVIYLIMGASILAVFDY